MPAVPRHTLTLEGAATASSEELTEGQQTERQWHVTVEMPLVHSMANLVRTHADAWAAHLFF